MRVRLHTPLYYIERQYLALINTLKNSSTQAALTTSKRTCCPSKAITITPVPYIQPIKQRNKHADPLVIVIVVYYLFGQQNSTWEWHYIHTISYCIERQYLALSGTHFKFKHTGSNTSKRTRCSLGVVTTTRVPYIQPNKVNQATQIRHRHCSILFIWIAK